MKNVLGLGEIKSEDASKVGEDIAKLGELRRNTEVPVHPGYATTSNVYSRFMQETGLREKITHMVESIDAGNIKELHMCGEQVRSLIKEADIPRELREDIIEGYDTIEQEFEVKNPEVAVRRLLNTEASEETVLDSGKDPIHVSDRSDLIKEIKNCFASVFTNTAISYREENGISHFEVKPTVLVQHTGLSGKCSSGLMSTVDPDSGSDNVIDIHGSYGFGQHITRGKVDADNFKVFKKNLGIIDRQLGDKQAKLVVDREEGLGIKREEVIQEEREKYCLTDNQVKELAKYGMHIEDYFEQPMEIEWMLNRESRKLYITHVETENISVNEENKIENYKLEEESEVVLKGHTIGSGINTGKVRVLESPRQIDRFNEGEILVTDLIGPEWKPIVEQAAAVVTNRDRGTRQVADSVKDDVPILTDTGTATSELETGQPVTLDFSTGEVWKGELEFDAEKFDREDIPETNTDIYIDVSAPEEAFQQTQLPVDGVGIVREESILSKSDGGEDVLRLVEEGLEEEYVNALREELGKIGAVFHPLPVRLRLSDFRAEESSETEGKISSEAFELKCNALNKLLTELALDNLSLIVPPCQSVEEAENIMENIEEYSLEEDLQVYMRVDEPSRITVEKDIIEFFDGFSIELRESTSNIKDELETFFEIAHDENKPVSASGDVAISDENHIEWLVSKGVDAVSVSPEIAIETKFKVSELEE